MTRRRSFDALRAPLQGAARSARTTACRVLSFATSTSLALAAPGAASGCAHDDPAAQNGDAAPVVLPGPDPVTAPRYDRVWATATHNSYWVDRGAKDDSFASGTNLRILDQLVAGRARSLEIDVHRDADTSARFRVYHTVPGNDLCDDLRDCLASVRVFHRALPRHEALNLTIELKELFASNFDDTHTIEDLDRILREELPGLLYSPAELLARCDRDTDARKVPRETLAACVARKDWPSIDELRGKIIVTVLGNWDDLGAAQATSDWVRYATKDDVRTRVAFPMASSWKLAWPDLGTRVQELVTQQSLDAALAQSVFLQIEALDDAKIDPFLARKGIIRVDGATTADDQRQRLERGMQLMQTDTPFVRYGSAAPSSAFSALEPGLPLIAEPGSRLLLLPSDSASERVFAWVPFDAATSSTTWDTLVSSVADDTPGCLRLADGDGPAASSFTVCRARIDAHLDTAPDAQRENALVMLETCRAIGGCVVESHPSKEPSLGGVGDLLQLTARHDGARTCARARSTDAVDRALVPGFVDVGEEVCFDAVLDRIGFAILPRTDAVGDAGAAWFVGARRDELPIAASSLTVSVEGGAAPARLDPTHLQDSTVP